jgi:hypothetical protein
MGRSQPWSEIGESASHSPAASSKKPPPAKEPRKLSLRELGQRSSFGMVCGSLMGGSIGVVDTLQVAATRPDGWKGAHMNARNLTREMSEVAGRTMLGFGASFATYQALRCVWRAR